MAVVGPVLVADTTNTNGTGSLSLNNASSDGRRGLADAVTNGDAANTEEVHYLILATNTSGGTLRFEKGIGTISDNGATLSRDTVHQSSNSGNKVSLPGGSTHDVLIAVGLEDLVVAANEGTEFTPATFATNLGLPRLAAANTFTAQRNRFAGASVGNWVGLQVKNANASSTGNRAALEHAVLNSDEAEEVAAQVRARLTTLTAGSEDGEWSVLVDSGGTLTERLRLSSDGTLTAQPSGNKYDALESGTQFTCHSTIPVGWSRVNVAGERVVKLAESGDTVGGTGGSWTVSGLSGSTTVNNHTLTINEMPSHDHPSTVDGSPRGYLRRDGTTNLWEHGTGGSFKSEFQVDTTVGAQGGGAGHNHTASTTVSSNGSWRPAYRIACIIQKD